MQHKQLVHNIKMSERTPLEENVLVQLETLVVSLFSQAKILVVMEMADL